MSDPWWAYAIGLSVTIGPAVLGPPWAYWTNRRRRKRQELRIADGVITLTDSAFGGTRHIPVADVDTVAYFPPREPDRVLAPITSEHLAANSAAYREAHVQASGGGGSLFSWGGLILLDARGRMLGHVVYQVGTDEPLEQVGRQIPAPNHVQVPPNKLGTGYSRKAFKQAYPKALHFAQMWSVSRWVWTIVGMIFIGCPVAVFVVIVVIAAIQAA